MHRDLGNRIEHIVLSVSQKAYEQNWLVIPMVASAVVDAVELMFTVRCSATLECLSPCSEAEACKCADLIHDLCLALSS